MLNILYYHNITMQSFTSEFLSFSESLVPCFQDISKTVGATYVDMEFWSVRMQKG